MAGCVVKAFITSVLKKNTLLNEGLFDKILKRMKFNL